MKRLFALVALCVAAVTTATAAERAPYVPAELTFTITPSENAKDTIQRYQPLANALEKALNTKVKLSVMTDYAAMIEAMRNKRIDLAHMTPSAYARLHKVSRGDAMPIAAATYKNGATGYKSVLWVRKDSPYQKLEDLKSKPIAWVDANSASGYIVPRYYLSKQGINPNDFFGRSVMAGSHETAIMALLNKQTEAAATWFDVDTNTAYHRMVSKKMVPADMLRVVWSSPPLPNPPFVMRKSSDPQLVQAIQKALADLPKNDPAMCTKLWDQELESLDPVTHEKYADITSMMEESDKLRK